MSSAIISGLVHTVPPKRISVFDIVPERVAKFKQDYQIAPAESVKQAVNKADSVLLCVKPQDMEDLGQMIKHDLEGTNSLIISIAGGLKISTLSNWFGEALPIVRAMPNTPCTIKEGMTTLYANNTVSAEQKKLAEEILKAVGSVHWFKSEDQIGAGIAAAGSSPAYVFLMMEHMIKGAMEMGLSEQEATNLVVSSIYGASKLAKESKKKPADLRRNVTSEGGMTAAALDVFKRDKFEETVKSAMRAASYRDEEMSKILAQPKSDR